MRWGGGGLVEARRREAKRREGASVGLSIVGDGQDDRCDMLYVDGSLISRCWVFSSRNPARRRRPRPRGLVSWLELDWGVALRDPSPRGPTASLRRRRHCRWNLDARGVRRCYSPLSGLARGVSKARESVGWNLSVVVAVRVVVEVVEAGDQISLQIRRTRLFAGLADLVR